MRTLGSARSATLGPRFRLLRPPKTPKHVLLTPVAGLIYNFVYGHFGRGYDAGGRAQTCTWCFTEVGKNQSRPQASGGCKRDPQYAGHVVSLGGWDRTTELHRPRTALCCLRRQLGFDDASVGEFSDAQRVGGRGSSLPKLNLGEESDTENQNTTQEKAQPSTVLPSITLKGPSPA